MILLLFAAPLFIPLQTQQNITAPRDALAWVSQPFVWLANIAQNVTDAMRNRDQLRQRNEELTAENQNLYQWEAKARALQAENDQLRAMMPFVREKENDPTWMLARVISDSGALFTRSLLLKAGRDEGVAPYSMARDHQGMMGYAVAVGEEVTQILLLTDINARVPVKMLSSNIHAILTGDNSPEPWLNFVEEREGQEPIEGDYVVTSGRGGVFPEGVAIGRLQINATSGGERMFRVLMLAEPQRARYAFVQKGAP